MYSLPLEYWDEESLNAIGNGLGGFIKFAEETKLQRHTSYAHICICMRLGKALMDSVSLLHDDFEWIQPIDYEHVPFRCRRCHAHGHLFRDCPLNASSKTNDHSEKSDSEGFTKVTNQKKHIKKPPHGLKNSLPTFSAPSTNNIFDILSQHAMPEADMSKMVEPSTMRSNSSKLNESILPLQAKKNDQQKETSHSIPFKEKDTILWQVKGMDIDSFLLDPTKTTNSMPESNQQSQMEEDGLN